MKKKYFSIIISIGFYWIGIKYTYAVPPPDFIMQVVSQFLSFFTIGIILLSGLYATGIQFLRGYYQQHKKYFFLIGIPTIIVLAGIGAYYINSYYQGNKQAEYNRSWIEQLIENKQNSRKLESIPITTSPIISGEIDTNSGMNYSNGTGINNNTSKAETGDITIRSPISNGEILNIGRDFFENNKNSNLKITNNEFKKIIDGNNQDYIILDAREDMEYEIGHIPNSLHMRFIDIKKGKGLEILKNKYIVVICWSGMRGKEVAEYLRGENIVSRYLEKGVDSWVEFGGLWQGEVKFSKIYGKNNYSLIFDTEQVRQKIKEGILLIDSRSPEKYNQKHIDGSINISVMNTESNKLNEIFDKKITDNIPVIIICDDYINCFDAKLTGIELEKRGTIFLGRYNKPWEY